MYSRGNKTSSTPFKKSKKKGFLISKATIPIIFDFEFFKVCADKFFMYPSSSAVSITFLRNSSLTPGLADKALETVDGEIFKVFAMSLMVGFFTKIPPLDFIL